MKHKWDMIFGITGGVLSLIFFGGISVTFYQLTFPEFEKSIGADMARITGNSMRETFEMMRQLTGYFGISLFISLLLLTLALIFSLRDKFLTAAAILYALTGVVLLLGTQLIAYPLAFLFFVASGYMVYRNYLNKEVKIGV